MSEIEKGTKFGRLTVRELVAGGDAIADRKR